MSDKRGHMRQILTKIFGDPQAKILKRLRRRVIAINGLAEHYKGMTLPELKKQTQVLEDRLSGKKTTLDELLPDAFALMREASDRVLKMRHFDVQLIGGMALHE